jgi:hypothetical protein
VPVNINFIYHKLNFFFLQNLLIMEISEKLRQQNYSNPTHPLDLDLSKFDIIRNEFEKAKVIARENNSEEEGISIEVFY